MKKLLVSIFCLSLAVAAYAQQPEAAEPVAPPREIDVIHLKNGTVYRGQIVGGNRTVEQIGLRDGSVFVYRKQDVRMRQKEDAGEGRSARQDSARIAGIAKNVIEAELARERRAEEARRHAEEMQRLLETRAAQEQRAQREAPGFKLYSSFEAVAGIGTGNLPSDTLPAPGNTNRLVGVNYFLGGRTDFFAIGLSTGIHQTHRTNAVAAQDTITQATTLLAVPIGWDLRLELARQTAGMAPYIGFNGGFAVSLTEDAPSYMMLNPAFGLRFGRKTSSLFSVGMLMQIENGNTTNFLSLKMGIIF